MKPSLLKRIKHALGIYTEDEMFQRGKDVVDMHLREAECVDSEVQYLFNMASGGFNLNKKHVRFDEGVECRLGELGYYRQFPL